MKTWLISTLLLFSLVLAPVRAQDEEKDDEAELRDFKKEREERVQLIREKMKYFDSHEGEWTGTQTDVYTLVGGKKKKVAQKDEWTGHFTLGRVWFQMDGTASGEDGASSYTWMCTYDPEAELYRATYFGDDGSTTAYEMEWSEEKKTLIWRTGSEEEGRLVEFIQKVEGNEMTGGGETKSALNNEVVQTTELKYKKKKLKI